MPMEVETDQKIL